MARERGAGVVLTFDGEGHTVYPESGCIDEAVHAYLFELTPPAEGATC